jgi:transposase-like protein
MITCIHQRRNGMTYFDVPLRQSLLDIICTRVEYGSTIFTDEYRAYDHSWKNMASYTKV